MYLVRSQGQFRSLEDIRNLVVLTREGVPVYLRDIAEVKDTTEQRRSFMRINGKPGVRIQVQKQSGKNTVAVAAAVRAEVERVNKEVNGIKMTITQDNSVFIERAIKNVQEHAMIGGILVVLIIFAFLRDLRSTLIVCTSIPVSVVGTFALLYFGGFTLNTMTFGGLALGIGMIVDAAIVVLENTHRHLHMGKDKMKAAIEGSEEVWSAILASTLTHIAVFIPLLFLSGTASIMFTQLSVVVMFSLAMSLFVAVTIVPVLCSRWLKTPDEEATATGIMARFYGVSERFLERMDERYRQAIHVALNHRPTVIGGAAALVVLAAVLYPQIQVELMPQADEGEVNVNAELAVGTRIERTEEALLKLEEMVKENVPEMVTIITEGGGGGNNWQGGGGGSTHRGQIRIMLKPRDQRDAHERGDRGRAAPAAGWNAAWRGRPRQPVGRQQPDHAVPQRRRPEQQRRLEPAAARDSRPRSRRCATAGPGRARDDGGYRGHRRRPDRTRRRPAGDRRESGPSQGRDAGHVHLQRGHHDPDQRRRDDGRAVPRARQRIPRGRAAARRGSRSDLRRRRRAAQHAQRSGRAGEERPHWSIARPVRSRFSARTWSASRA